MKPIWLAPPKWQLNIFGANLEKKTNDMDKFLVATWLQCHNIVTITTYYLLGTRYSCNI
jgi:hypothetical protein